MNRLLLTGGAGAIGVHVTKYLIEKTDWEIILTDSFEPDHKGYLDRFTALEIDRSRIKLIVHDLNAPFTDRQLYEMGEIDYVVNLASRSDVHNSIIDPRPFVTNNVALMLNMLDLAVKKKPKTFLHFSTDEVYGPAPKDSKGHPEWDKIVPSNPYSASKACQEALCIAWWRSYGVPLILTNTMNNFGETQAPSKFPAMIQTKIEKGETIPVHSSKNGEIGTRYYIHSRNTADAILFILKNVQPVIHSDGQIDLPVRLNIVGDKQISNLDLVKIIGKLMGKEPKYEMVYFHESNPGHDLHYGLDGDKLESLGWKSPETFEESMERTINWQKEHKEWL